MTTVFEAKAVNEVDSARDRTAEGGEMPAPHSGGRKRSAHPSSGFCRKM